MNSERNGGNENMKTDNALLEQMLSDTNLRLAYKQVKRNKGTSGVDGMEVDELKGYLDDHLEEIKDSIRTVSYTHLIVGVKSLENIAKLVKRLDIFSRQVPFQQLK